MRDLLLLSLGLLASSRPADACSAPMCWPGAFVPGDGATIPENAPGFYWRPTMTTAPADPSMVRLTRVADPTTSLGFTATPLPSGDYVLTPDAPLVAGEQYALEDRTQCSGAGTRTTFTAAPSAPLPGTLGTVQLIAHGIRTDLDVATAAGSCSTTIDATVLSITLDESADALPWKDLLLYETLVDDQPWVNQASINLRTAPGASWRGRGDDVLYRICAPNPDALQPGLAIGGHEVRFRATLPGATTSLATPAQAVELMCDARPGDEQMTGDDDGGGCATSTPAPAGLVLLALGLLRFTARPSGRRWSRSARSRAADRAGSPPRATAAT